MCGHWIERGGCYCYRCKHTLGDLVYAYSIQFEHACTLYIYIATRLSIGNACVNVPSALMLAMEPIIVLISIPSNIVMWVVLCWESKWMSTSAQVIAQIPYSSLEWMPILGPYKSTSHAGPNTYKPSTELPLWCIVVHRAMCNRSILRTLEPKHSTPFSPFSIKSHHCVAVTVAPSHREIPLDPHFLKQHSVTSTLVPLPAQRNPIP